VVGLPVCSFDVLLNQLGVILDVRNLRGLVWLRKLEVFVVVRIVGLVAPPNGFNAGGVVGARRPSSPAIMRGLRPSQDLELGDGQFWMLFDRVPSSVASSRSRLPARVRRLPCLLLIQLLQEVGEHLEESIEELTLGGELSPVPVGSRLGEAVWTSALH